MEFPLAQAAVPRLVVLPSAGSTNDVLAGLVRDDPALPHLTTVVTRDQREGRGRLGRAWAAPAGTALAISVLIRAEHGGRSMLPGGLGWLPLAAGTAMAQALTPVLPTTTRIEVKWPNDVLLDGRKVSGILCEAVADPPGVIVGAGVNVALRDDQLPVATATSLVLAGGADDPDRVLAGYLSALDALVERLLVAGGDATASGIRAAVTGACGTLGSAVRVELPSGEHLVGTGDRLDGDGRLVVRLADGGERTVAAGDVRHLRHQTLAAE